MPRVQRTNNWNEVWGLVWAAAGFFLFLALVSFNARDLPGWVFFSPGVRTSGPATNLIGSVGAVIAGFSYWFLGGAAFLLSVTLLGFGGLKLFSSQFKVLPRLGWFVAFLISAACLLDLQPWFLGDWKKTFHIPGPGGWVGHAFGAGFFERNLNSVGSAIVLSAIYLVSLIRMTGLRPVALLRQQIDLLKKRAQEAEKRRYEEADALGRLEIEAERVAKEVRDKEKKLRKKNIPIQEEAKPEPKEERRPTPAPIPVAPPPEPEPEEAAIEPVTAATAKTEEAGGYDWFGLGKKKGKRGKAVKEEEAVAVAEMARPILVDGDYALPGSEILDRIDPASMEGTDAAELEQVHDLIVETLSHFGVRVHKGIYTPGPTITRYEVIPDRGVRVAKILEFERDLARATCAERINILAPIPGKETIGVELANSKKQKVTFRQLLERPEWIRTKASIPLCLGLDVYGDPIVADLAKMPHLLVAGTTGSGKSVCINAIIASILFRFTPQQLQFVMIDPKVVEMQVYNDLPHLAMPVVTEPKRVLRALSWVVGEMERRYRIFAETSVRNITSFNGRPKKKKEEPKPKPEAPELDLTKTAPEPSAATPLETEGETVLQAVTGENEEVDAASSSEILGPQGGAAHQVQGQLEVPRDEELIPDTLPFIVVIIDELADLMQTAPADVEAAIARITQMARAAGIHMIVATQTPRADVITGVIKANVPSRIAFQVASKLDSRVILDANGADKLIGQGDMIYLPPGSAQQIRAQGVLVTDDEIRRLVEFCSDQKEPSFSVDLDSISDRLSGGSGGDGEQELSDRDRDLIDKCMEIMRREKKASASMFQTRLRIGYPKAAFIMNWLEERNFVKPGQGAKHREVNFEVLGVGEE